MQINKTTIIAISSPFQCICALEAIETFSLQNYDIYVICNEGKRREQIIMILERFNKKAIVLPSPDYFIFLYKYIITSGINQKRYEFGLCGDFKNVNMQLFLTKYLKDGAEIMYLDDGFTSIYPLNDLRYKDTKIRIRKLFYNVYKLIKHIKDDKYFTIFRSTTNKISVYKNELRVLKLPNNLSQSGVYLLGTVTQFIDSILPELTFDDYFKATIDFIKREFPSEPIFYSPHSRSVDTEYMKQICLNNSVSIIESDFSVEIDYSSKGYNPYAIVGFGSTALITLKKIYNNARIININLPSKENLYRKKNNFINGYLKKEKIETHEVL